MRQFQPQLCEGRGECLVQRSRCADELVPAVEEGHVAAVEHHPPGGGAAVWLVPQDGEAAVGQVDPDLMGPAGLGAGLQQGISP